MTTENLYFYGYSISLFSEDERSDAREHLDQWKKYLMRILPVGWKLPSYPDGSPGNEEYAFELIERPAMKIENFCGKTEECGPISSLKLCFEFDGDPLLMPSNNRLR